MRSICNSLKNRQYQSGVAGSLAVLAFAAVMVVAAGCGSEASQTSCDSDANCSVGTVCTAEGVCEGGVDCQFCTEEQICYTGEDPEGECSVPECGAGAQGRSCGEGETCEGGQCVSGDVITCESDDACPEGMTCDALGKCVDPDGDDDSSEDPDAGTIEDASTDGGGTEDPDTGTDAGTDGGNTCPSGGPSDCPPGHSPEATKWSTDYCACVECTSDSDCGDGQSCRNGACQEECAQTCSSSGGSTNCPSDTPYCLTGCCVECVGNADCGGDQVCVDGTCGVAPEDCTDNPGDCPEGYTCNATSGECEQQESNQECTEQNPNCPPGETCNTMTNTCEAPSGGGGSCGQCQQNCTCPGNLTCNLNLACTGCAVRLLSSESNYFCPSGQNCIPLGSGFSGDPHPDNVCTSF